VKAPTLEENGKRLDYRLGRPRVLNTDRPSFQKEDRLHFFMRGKFPIFALH
jgi:hypothetical protein